MKNLIRMIKKDESKELEIFIEEIGKEDELKVKAFANRSTYVNPCTLRLGGNSNQKRMYFVTPSRDYCPV